MEEDDGALTVHHEGHVASLRVVTIAEGLEMVSLTQILAWDLPLTNEIRTGSPSTRTKRVLGTVSLGRAGGRDRRRRGRDAALQLSRAGLTDDALRTLIMMVLAAGADVRRALIGELTPSQRVRRRAQMPKISMVWLTSEKPCSRATSAAHFSTCAALHLDGAAADPAHQVMVMVFGAAPVDGFAGVGAQGVDEPGGRHRLQCAVDGGQADALAAAAQFVVQFLGGPEFVEVVQQRRDRRALPGGAHSGRALTGAVLRGVGTAASTIWARWWSTSR